MYLYSFLFLLQQRLAFHSHSWLVTLYLKASPRPLTHTLALCLIRTPRLDSWLAYTCPHRFTVISPLCSTWSPLPPKLESSFQSPTPTRKSCMWGWSFQKWRTESRRLFCSTLSQTPRLPMRLQASLFPPLPTTGPVSLSVCWTIESPCTPVVTQSPRSSPLSVLQMKWNWIQELGSLWVKLEELMMISLWYVCPPQFKHEFEKRLKKRLNSIVL